LDRLLGGLDNEITMLNQIKVSRPSSSIEDAIDMLLGCHERIRHFSSVAVKLAHAQGASPADIVEAANGLLRYFTIALPLHEADENDSLRPRLRRALPKGELAESALDAMVEQHEFIDEVAEQLVPLWRMVKSNPEKLDEVSGEMCQLSGRLNDLFSAHLQLEEETIFPALQRFVRGEELESMVREMKERRQ
jgi:hemerythrin-like domain-containing protein